MGSYGGQKPQPKDFKRTPKNRVPVKKNQGIPLPNTVVERPETTQDGSSTARGDVRSAPNIAYIDSLGRRDVSPTAVGRSSSGGIRSTSRGGTITMNPPRTLSARVRASFGLAQPTEKRQIGTLTTSRYLPPSDPVPTYKGPTFEAPARDKGRISSLRRTAAAPGIRKLRQATQQALTRSYSNPNMRRIAIRDALAGYGMGLESVMSGADTQARTLYEQEYAQLQNEANINYQREAQVAATQFQTAWDSWMKSGTTETTTTAVYEK